MLNIMKKLFKSKSVDEVENKELEEIKLHNQRLSKVNNSVGQNSFDIGLDKIETKTQRVKNDEYSLKVGKYYEEKGYKVIYNRFDVFRKKDKIDLICINNKHTLLIKCRYKTKEKSINDLNIKDFHSNAMLYILKNALDKETVIFKYIVPDKKVFHSSAIRLFKDNSFNCKYEVV